MGQNSKIGEAQKQVTRLLQIERERQELSYRDLEKLTGISHMKIFRVLENKNSLLYDDFLTIAKALRISPLDLVSASRQQPFAIIEEQEPVGKTDRFNQ
ncbi:helix-turn-helix domain-containing protein [Mobiluncus curtisii]|uniref:helix-turn-helix domain-containing protein n=1 Tax=Mobiluncus curtisii TaxID=2051 RepID=UPI00242AD421|nr:helix-turn-helix transcriptional regulator [Mobiluncus curtisii]